MESLERFQQEVTNYLFLEDKLQKADVIFVPGNSHPQIAEAAARLWREGYAPYILPSGKFSITQGCFAGVRGDKYSGEYKTEWEFLKSVLMENGVCENAILKEDQATYTYENAIYSRQVTDEHGLNVRRGILCCRNYHARRCLMYYRLQFPDTEFMVCPIEVEGIHAENWMKTKEGIEGVLGEAKRMIHQFNLMMK